MNLLTNSRLLPSICGAGAILGIFFPGLASAVVLYSENFDINATANWTVNKTATGNHPVDFFFDYSTVGIQPAPGGSTTIGLKMQGNLDPTPTISGDYTGVFGGVSVSPTGKSFTGSYKLEFDMWLNFNGPAPAGGSGSTQAGGGGIGTAGTAVQIAGVADSIHFSATTDGNSAADFRAYYPNALSGATSGGGVFAAGSNNNSAAGYASFTATTAPAAQLALFPQQTGSSNVGSIPFAWRHIVIENDAVAGTVKWSIDGLLIATVNSSTAGALGGSNILLNYYDTNATFSTDPLAGSLLFGLIDNVVVTQIPEPAAAGLALLGVAGILRRRKK